MPYTLVVPDVIPRRFWWPLLLSACSSSSLLASKGASGILLTPSAEARLKYYLKDAKIDEGETLHGFRSGSTITLALSGSQLADVMSHVGWSNKGTALISCALPALSVVLTSDKQNICLQIEFLSSLFDQGT